jgi:membrane fusion protein, multidrug efflux system
MSRLVNLDFLMRPAILFFALAASAQAVGAAERFTVHANPIDDRKAVIATVEPVHQLVARARIGGTVATLRVKEGDFVKAEGEIALVADQKLALQMQALDSRIQSQQAQRDQAKMDFDRAQELQKRSAGTQTQLDQARTALDVADRNLAAIRADRQVIVQQATEGAVLSPGAGRVLRVPVSEGSVVLPGETIATLAEDKYILRLSLPERHAQYIKQGDPVLIGSRGLTATSSEGFRKGSVRLVYPEIQGGRVIADVNVEGLGDYFVGERTRVYISTGKRDAIVIPRDFLLHRSGVNFVRLKDGTEVVVQPGGFTEDGIEILSGLKDGDELVSP